MQTSHQGFKLAFFLVIGKQLLCQCRLIIEHVNQETERAEIVSKMLESFSHLKRLRINFRIEQMLNA